MRIIIILSILFVGIGQLAAQTPQGMVKKTTKPVTPTAVTETMKVLGNCGMCKKTIEKAALNAGATSANWDLDKDLLTVVFDPSRTNKDAIQKAVAMAGYDNEGYKASDKAYDALHSCCHYDRTGAAGGTKSCEADSKQ